MKKYVKLKLNDKIICEKCELANNPITRFNGLMFRKRLNKSCGLLLEPCNQVHTFNMRFAIDVITMDKDNMVLEIFNAVKPWRVKPMVKGGRKVLELNENEAVALGIRCGDTIEIA
jgi:hypothetical protein